MNEEQLLKYLQEIIETITFKIAITDLTRDEKAERLVMQITGLLDQFGLKVEEVIPKTVLHSYFHGVDDATKAMLAAGIAANPEMAITPAKTIAKAFQRKIHMEAVQELLDDTLMDLRAAIRTAKNSAASSITKTLARVKGDLTKGLIIGDPRKVMQAQVARSFAEDGLTAFITKDNRRLPLDFYSMVVTRYKTREAHTKGAANRYTENGQDLVQISGNRDTCPICGRYRGLVFSLNGETRGFRTSSSLPPFHPNCRCTIIPYAADFKTDQEIDEAKKRSNSYDPKIDPRTAAEKKAYEREQEARRRANAEKKQYARWKMALGDDAPKTLGAFRRMKRQNTKRFQELQSEYRSIMQTAGK